VDLTQVKSFRRLEEVLLNVATTSEYSDFLMIFFLFVFTPEVHASNLDWNTVYSDR
jgi:hypothetical protein